METDGAHFDLLPLVRKEQTECMGYNMAHVYGTWTLQLSVCHLLG